MNSSENSSGKTWIHKAHWPNIIVYSVLICSFIPKIVISEGINIFFPELVMVAGLILGIRQFITYKEQRLMLGIFLPVLVYSILAQGSVSDIGSILRSFKELLYIPIIYWASCIKDKNKVLKHLLIFGCIAYAVNIGLYLQSFSAENTIWSGAESLSSGMSNRGFNISSFRLIQLEGLAHGIWGSYCILIFMIGISLKKQGLISGYLLFLASILFTVNMLITISRESILLLIIIFLLVFFRSKISVIKRFSIVGFVLLSIVAVATFGSDLPVVQKITYTYTSLTETRSEGNFMLRINTWAAYFNFIGHHIEYFILGLGLSPDNFYNHIVHYSHVEIVNVPESIIVYTQAYGGLISFCSFLVLVITAAMRINSNSPYKLIKYLFIGLLFTNIISSVSMFSDLLYAHLCLVYGLLIARQYEY